jgi:hypothetical protein
MNCVSSSCVSIATILGDDFAVSFTGDLAGAKPASSALEFTGLSESEAERVVATVWRILEAHALISPTIEVRVANALMDIRLIFESAVDRALVENSLLSSPS